MDKEKLSQKQTQMEIKPDSPFQPRESTRTGESPMIHSFGRGRVCDTESRGRKHSHGGSPIKIVIDASEGFIPLWAKDTTLRWRFRERSMDYFKNPESAKDAIRMLLGKAILAWGTAAPIKFKEDNDVYDFEFVMKNSNECNAYGCVLASAFFPDSGRHTLDLYPALFNQPEKEQIDTLVHEIGHIFGLRHFFADTDEKKWPSVIFGEHSKFSIMNYGELSEITEYDRTDLQHLYELAWSGTLISINKTPIKLMVPYHVFGYADKNLGIFAAAAKISEG